MRPVLGKAESRHGGYAVLKAGEDIKGDVSENKGLRKQMLADDGQSHFVGYRLINRVTKGHADNLGIRLHIERTERFLDQLEIIAPVVRRKGRAIAVQRQLIGTIHDRKRAARLSITDAERVA